MKDPERLLSSNATDFERLVLCAARAEQPSPAHHRVMRRALIFAEFAFLTAGLKAAASTVSEHWVAFAMVAGVLAGNGSSPLANDLALDNPTAKVERVRAQGSGPTGLLPVNAVDQAAPSENADADLASAMAPGKANGALAPGKSSSHVTPSAKSVDLREEIRLLDKARAELRSGAANQAIATLGQYRSEFPAGAFQQEASVLRIEALATSGNRTLAVAEAKRFVAQHPRSPHAERLERLLLPQAGSSKP